MGLIFTIVFVAIFMFILKHPLAIAGGILLIALYIRGGLPWLLLQTAFIAAIMYCLHINRDMFF